MHGIEPIEVFTTPQPRQLTLRKLPASPQSLLAWPVPNRIFPLDTAMPADIRPHASADVSAVKSLLSRKVRTSREIPWPAWRESALRFFDAGRLVRAARQQVRARPRRRERTARLLQAADALAGQPVHFEGPLDALRIVDVNSRRGFRIHARELPMNRRPPAARRLRIDLGAHVQIRLGQLRKTSVRAWKYSMVPPTNTADGPAARSPAWPRSHRARTRPPSNSSSDLEWSMR